MQCPLFGPTRRQMLVYVSLFDRCTSYIYRHIHYYFILYILYTHGILINKGSKSTCKLLIYSYSIYKYKHNKQLYFFSSLTDDETYIDNAFTYGSLYGAVVGLFSTYILMLFFRWWWWYWIFNNGWMSDPSKVSTLKKIHYIHTIINIYYHYCHSECLCMCLWTIR